MDTHPASSRFRQQLLDGDVLFGAFLKMPTTQPAEVLGALGLDFFVADQEHAPLDRGATDLMLLAARACGIAGLVRVRGPEDILSSLDSGAAGVLVPHVNSAEKAREVVALCRHRNGKRGFSPTTRAGRFGATPMLRHIEETDAAVAVIAMIEDAHALDSIDEIVSVEGLDAVFIGRGDLAVSLGVSAADALVTEKVETIIRSARARNVRVFVMSSGPAEARALHEKGVSGFIIGSDQGFLRTAAFETHRDYKAALGRTEGKSDGL